MMNILIVDEVHESLIHLLEEQGFDLTYKPNLQTKKAIALLHSFNGLIIRSKFKVTRDIIEKAPNLKFIGRVGAGLENIDVAFAREKGIKCFNSPEGNRDAVGEHALGMLLVLLNKLFTANTEVKEGLWDRVKNRGIEIKSKTIGILGYGNMGSAFAEKLKGLGCHVIAYDKYKYNFGNEYVKEVTLEQLFEDTDILSIHVPLTSETKYMIDEAFIISFRKPVVIINTARGSVVKTDDLVQSLNNNKVTAAALDVLEFEQTSFEALHQNEELPEYFYELTKMDNVILSPHVAGWTNESYQKISEIIAKKIIATFIH